MKDLTPPIDLATLVVILDIEFAAIGICETESEESCQE